VGLQLYELAKDKSREADLPELYRLNEELSQLLSDAVRTLLDLKTVAKAIHDKLTEVAQHMRDIEYRCNTMESREAVLMVESMTIDEETKKLNALLPAQGGQWGTLHTNLKTLGTRLESLGEALERQYTRSEWQAAGLSDTRELLLSCSASTIESQWSSTCVLIDQSLGELLLPLLQSLGAVGANVRGSMEQHRSLSARWLQWRNIFNEQMEQILPEVQLMLVRVDSCFDFEMEANE
jgi:hypothetical protein